MIVDHTELARTTFNESALPAPPRSIEDALRYVTRLLALLPAEEHAGYVKGPAGGENVAALPDGTLVRVSRVMYPDGQIYKVLSDAPNGGPQWVAEDVRAELYVPYTGGSTPQPPPEPDFGPVLAQIAALETRLASLESQVHGLTALHAEVSKQIGVLNEQLAALSTRTPPPWPDYLGRVGPFTIVSKVRT